MQSFKIPVIWTVKGTITIEAESLDKAIELFDDGVYSEDWEIMPDMDRILEREEYEIIVEANRTDDETTT